MERRSVNSMRLVPLLALCGVAGGAIGTPTPASPVSPASAPASTPAPTPAHADNPLAGPSVDAGATPTLVKRDFEGTLERLDTRPEAAAVELLTLTKDQRTLVDDVLRRRTADVQRVTEENLELILKLQSARQGGDRKEAMSLMRDFRVVAEPLLKPSLFNQIRDVLPQDQRGEFARLVDEYVAALAAEPDPMGGMGMQRGQRRGIGGDAARDANGEPAPDPDADTRMGEGAKEGARNGPPTGIIAKRRVEMNLLVREIARNFGDMVEERRERTDEMLKAINATQEQEAKIRAILRAGGEANGLKPTPDQRAERFRSIMDVLTPEQRRALMDWQRGKKAGSTPE